MHLYLGNDKGLKSLSRLNIIEKQYGPNLTLMNSENAGNKIGILTDGLAKLSILNIDGRERIVSFVKPLSIFGEVTLFINKKFSPFIEFISITPVQVAYVSLEEFKEIILLEPDLGFSLLSSSFEKVASLISHLNGSSFLDTETMVADALLSLKNEDDVVRLSHSEIARIVGRSRVAVSKSLVKLQNNGAIIQKTKQIIIKNDQLLQHVVNKVFR